MPFNFKSHILLPPAELEHAEAELQIFRENMRNALEFLKNSSSFLKKIFPTKTPLFLIIGADSAGKSSLLTQSGLNLVDANQQDISNPMSTRYCHFWFSKNEIFVDTAGNYTTASSTDLSTNLAWRGLIKLINKYKRHCPLSGLILAFDLPNLSKDKTRLAETLANVKQRIYEIAKYAKDLPIFLVLTKSDLIYGFTDFFANLSTEEKEQLFGVGFQNPQNLLPAQSFARKFTHLLESLNNRVLSLLHQEPQLKKRFRIKDFPLQIEKLKNTIAEIINEIPSNSKTRLHGVYFTSSLQHGNENDFLLNKYVPSDVNVDENITSTPTFHQVTKKHYPFFVKELFRKITEGTKKKTKLTDGLTIKPFLIIGIILFSFWSIIFLFHHLPKNSIDQKFLAKTELTYQDFGDLDAVYLALQKAKHDLSQAHYNWLIFKNSHLKKLYTDTKKQYQFLLHTKFMPNLNNLLNLNLSTKEQHNIYELYPNLKAYLMLSSSKNLDVDYLEDWFSHFQAKNLAKDKKNLELEKNYLNDALAMKLKITKDPRIVAMARNRLKDFPDEQIAYVILNSESTRLNQRLVLASDRKAIFDTSQFNLPKLYSGESLDKFDEKIEAVLLDAISHNEILSKAQTTRLLESNLKELIKKIQPLYLANYFHLWNKNLNAIKIHTFSDLRKIGKEYKLLAENDSPLINLLEKIKTNTSVKSPDEKFNASLEKKFKSWQEVDLDMLKDILLNNAAYFNDLSNGDSNQKAWKKTNDIMQNDELPMALQAMFSFAQKQPEPLKAWLNEMGNNSLDLLFKSSKSFINSAWSKEVLPKFNGELQNRFPFVATAKKEVTLENFTEFFGNKGVMDRFFNTYLAPFVDTNKSYWSLKDTGNRKLEISDSTLEMFMRAFLIQKMFFTKKDQDINLKFTLIPKELGPYVRSFTFMLAGQKVFFQDTPAKKQLTWPGKNPGVSISFTDQDGKTFENVLKEPWGLFRLLSQSNLEPTGDSKHYNLVFDLNGNSIKCELIADEAINPFIPDIINNFTCPASL